MGQFIGAVFILILIPLEFAQSISDNLIREYKGPSNDNGSEWIDNDYNCSRCRCIESVKSCESILCIDPQCQIEQPLAQLPTDCCYKCTNTNEILVKGIKDANETCQIAINSPCAEGPPGTQGDVGKIGENGIPGEPGAPGPQPSLKGYRIIGSSMIRQKSENDAVHDTSNRFIFIEAKKGPPGDRGIPGLPGIKGIKGDRGSRGSPGDVILLISCNLAGPKGEPGLPGTDGEAGLDGIDGSIGLPGPPGPVGTVGIPGLPGVKGNRGTDGEPGPPGPLGDKGSQGKKGDQGTEGPKGATGPRGLQGEPGEEVLLFSMPSVR